MTGEAFDYCADLVRRADEDRWLSAQYAPKADRPRLYALYALHLEIERVPAAVSEPPLGEIRLQWWREAIAEIVAGKSVRAHPVVQAAAEVKVMDGLSQTAFERAIDARARLLYGEGFTDAADLEDWLVRAEGYLAALAVRLLAPGETAFADAAAQAGAGLALFRQGATLAPHLAEAAHERGRAVLARIAPDLRRIEDAALPALLPVALSDAYARGRSPSALSRRWRLFRAMATGRVISQR